MKISDLADFYISNKAIRYQIHQNTAFHLFQTYLLNTAFPLWLEMRGLLVLHASSVTIGGHGVGFLGPSGMGKTTMACEMLRLGGQLLGDDLLVIGLDNNKPLIYPSFTLMRIWESDLENIGVNNASGQSRALERVHPDLPKYQIKDEILAKKYATEITPLSALIVLKRVNNNDHEPNAAALKPSEALRQLLRHSHVANSTIILMWRIAQRPWGLMWNA
jgi:hypothetical protein